MTSKKNKQAVDEALDRANFPIQRYAGIGEGKVKRPIGIAMEGLLEGDFVVMDKKGAVTKARSDSSVLENLKFTMGENVIGGTFLDIDPKTGRLVAVNQLPNDDEEDPWEDISIRMTAIRSASAAWSGIPITEIREERIVAIINTAKRFETYIREGK